MRRFGRLLVVLLGAGCVLLGATTSPPSRCQDPATDAWSADQLLDEARREARAGRPQESACLARRALDRSPYNSAGMAVAHTALGLYSEAAGDIDGALNAYTGAGTVLEFTVNPMSQWMPFGDAHPLRIDQAPEAILQLRDRIAERALALLPLTDDPAQRSAVLGPLLMRAGQRGDEAELRKLIPLMPCEAPKSDAEALTMLSSCGLISGALLTSQMQVAGAEDFAAFEQRWQRGGLAGMSATPSEELREQLQRIQPVLDDIEARLPPAYTAGALSARAALLNAIGDEAKARAAYAELAKTLESMSRDPALSPNDMSACSYLIGQSSALAMIGDPTAVGTIARTRALCARAFPGDSFAGLSLQASADLNEFLLASKQGDWTTAERAVLSALRFYHRAELRPGPTSGALGRSLAVVYLAQGQRDLARKTFEDSRRPDHLTWTGTMNRLAFTVDQKETVDQAQQLITGFALVPERKVQPLTFVALMQLTQGEPEQAARTLDEIERVVATASPWSRASAAELRAVLRARGGDRAGAVAAMEQALAWREAALPALASSADAAQLDALLVELARSAEFGVSLCLSGGCEERAARLALTGVLRQKGRPLELQARSLNQLRETLDLASIALYEQLRAARSALAQQSLSGGDAATLQAEVTRLEQALALRAPAMARAGQGVELSAVQAKLSPRDALIEFVVYRPYDLHFKPGTVAWGEPRYAAAVLRQTGPPVWRDLGAVAQIDPLIASARQMLADELGMLDEAGAHAALGALDAALLRPLEGALKGANRWFVAPDGPLNLLPFGALEDGAGQYRVASARVVTLTSGRELLVTPTRAESIGPELLIGAPDYGAGSEDPALNRAIGAWGAGFAPLPGTLKEVRALRKKLGSATVLTGMAATEAALKGAASPRVLHVATHGFFLGAGDPNSPLALMPGDPLLRSGLALAGANTGGQDGEDGLLTALEAAGLDLRGTQLVVLSACETGVGTVRAGDGVQGMRRALTLAGAESQVLSLWAVDDEATLILMQAFYTELTAGTDRAEALRKAQLALASSAEYAHPTWWAGWVLSGDDGPMAR